MELLTGYKDFSTERCGVMTCVGPKIGARFKVDRDLRPLFPYLNASLAEAKYFDSPKRIQFILDGVLCTLFSYEIVAAAFYDDDEAHLFAERLLLYLNEAFRKKIHIKPDHNTVEQSSPMEGELPEKVDCLKQDVSKIDFASVAERLGAIENCGKLAINCLGKDFIINTSGEMSSECHYNQWVHIPLLDYIAHGQGKSLSGDWLPFNQLESAASWSRFFAYRCEEDMRRLVDAHTELFFELLYLFGAQSRAGTNADHSLVFHPLPRLPIVINYCKTKGVRLDNWVLVRHFVVTLTPISQA